MEKSFLMRLFRTSNYLYRKRCPILPKAISFFIRIVYACELHPSTSIGQGSIFIHNGLGCVIHPTAKIGKNCRIYQNVTIGGRHNRGVPSIGNETFIGSGAQVLGGVKIGNNVHIGANAVVINDIPDGEVWAGVPAKKIRSQWGNTSG